MVVPKEIYIKKIKELEGFKIFALLIIAIIIIVILAIVATISTLTGMFFIYPFIVVALITLGVGFVISELIYIVTYFRTPSK